MKLILEKAEDVSVITESNKEGTGKDYYIQGVFLQANMKNQNGRVYPLHILEKEVKRYDKEFIQRGRSLGELNHPVSGPSINLDKVSHFIKELKKDGNNFIGKAKILDTPNGKIVKNFIDEGVQLGVSSRGVGTLKEKNGISEVQDDFVLATPADIVADPSAPDAFVNGIMEGKEFYWDGGVIKEMEAAEIKRNIEKTSSRNLDKAKIDEFEKFIKKVSSMY